MALNVTGLNASLLAFFKAPPATAAECGSSWGTAMQGYAAAIVPPSLSVATAAATLGTALGNAFTSPPASVVSNVESAFLAFATAVGVGMAPTFTGVPPATPVGFAVEFAKPSSQWAATYEAAATSWANRIHAWMTTGTAVLVAPPFTVTLWS